MRQRRGGQGMTYDIVQTVTFAAVAQHSLLRPEATTFLKAYRCHSLVSQNMKTPSTMNCEILNAMGNLFNIIWVNLFMIMDNANNKSYFYGRMRHSLL